MQYLQLGFKMSSLVGWFRLQKWKNNNSSSILETFKTSKWFSNQYSENSFHRDVKHGLKLNFHAEIIELSIIKCWNRCKNPDGAGVEGEDIVKY